MPQPPLLDVLLTLVEAAATTAFALSGLLAAATGLRVLALATGYELPRWSPEDRSAR